jgi:hypothetical protein
MDPDALGSFEFDPGTSSDVPRLEQLLDEVSRHASGIDALLLPEAAVTASEISDLDEVLEEHGVEALVASVRVPGTATSFRRNHVHVGVRTMWSPAPDPSSSSPRRDRRRPPGDLVGARGFEPLTSSVSRKPRATL